MTTHTDATTTILKCDFERIIYGLSEEDLEQIELYSTNFHKDIAFATFGITIPCLINAYIQYDTSKAWNDSFKINIFVGIFMIAIFIYSLIQGIIKYKTKISVYKQIKDRPGVRLSKPIDDKEQNATSSTWDINDQT